MQDGQGLGGTDNAAHALTDKEGQGVGVATQILTLPQRFMCWKLGAKAGT